ncbi:MAG: hypothetical protein AMQ22_01807 [Candidatus Methanofastidiosum methylothiophilum]|uniref:Uncharacterized protein n=1 Tax=Candidatus Methanofastidiosum methylothiophilum TaxID=1705564 RepID=A0A150IVK1_9EURY|nr:MAG: hypothetical protein AMQ22_01807 [Candidatus Methanofastidiosum methylthiophilus]
MAFDKSVIFKSPYTPNRRAIPNKIEAPEIVPKIIYLNPALNDLVSCRAITSATCATTSTSVKTKKLNISSAKIIALVDARLMKIIAM